MIRKIIIIVFFLLLFAPRMVAANSTEKENTNSPKIIPPAPTLIFPDYSLKTSKPKPIITGLTVNETSVYIYIDGVYNGKTEILNHDSGTANFAYTPFLNLSVGKHQVWAVSKDKDGNKSKVSNILEFIIEDHFPAPTLKQVIKNNKKPLITGLAKNDSSIKVFIDHKLDSTFDVVNHASGTANFAYTPLIDLLHGDHLIYMTAIDKYGKESPWSNMLSVKIGEHPKPQISETAALEDVLSNEKSDLYYNNIENLINNTDEELKKASDINYDNIGSSTINDINDENESGVYNEMNEKRSVFQSSLFVIFILIIIGWILWVNKEINKD